MNLDADLMMLQIPTTIWYSMGDEENFFRWLYSIPGYVSCEGVHKTLYVNLSLTDVTRESVQELVALFLRYSISKPSQLKPLEKSPVGEFFSDPTMYWHKLVFRDGVSEIES